MIKQHKPPLALQSRLFKFLIFIEQEQEEENPMAAVLTIPSFSDLIREKEKENQTKMAESDFTATLFDNLKLEDPWLPPSSWESIPSESGPPLTSHSSSSHPPLRDASSVFVSLILFFLSI